MPTTNAGRGALFAILAYTMWGFAPAYFKAISEVPPVEVIAHRVIWSFVFLIALVLVLNRREQLVTLLKDRKAMLTLTATSLLIGCNWLVFIWAVSADRMLDASLGYYINPIINIMLAMMFLGERLRKMQWVAVGLVVIGVLIQLVSFGSLPWVALVLSVSFGLYGLLRKKLPVDSITGLLVETLILLPLASLYLFVLTDSPTADFSQNSLNLNLLLLSAGVVTTLPLLCFASAAKHLRLSTLGFFQYIGPSLMFILAVTVYGEAFSMDKVVTFGFIWVAVMVFSMDGYRASRSNQPALAS